jgi:hypothetical protein
MQDAAALFTEVRGIRILRTSPFGDSANFALTEFYEVRMSRSSAYERPGLRSASLGYYYPLQLSVYEALEVALLRCLRG